MNVLLARSIDLLVSVSVVARPTNVSVAAGRVNEFDPATAVARTVIVPEVEPLNVAPVAPMVAPLIVGLVNVLFVKVCVPVSVATVLSILKVTVSVVAPEVTTLSKPVPPTKTRVSVARATEDVPVSPLIPRVVVIDAVVTLVIKPFALTVMTGIDVVEPNAPTFPLTVARVSAAETAAVPSTDVRDAVASPVSERVRGVAHAVAVDAFPVNAALIVPAVKLPEASRFTSVDAVFAFVAALTISV